jgi:hypothetical protein
LFAKEHSDPMHQGWVCGTKPDTELDASLAFVVRDHVGGDGALDLIRVESSGRFFEMIIAGRMCGVARLCTWVTNRTK